MRAALDGYLTPTEDNTPMTVAPGILDEDDRSEVAHIGTEMIGQFGLHRPVHDPRRQVGQDPVGPEKLKALGLDLGHQPVQRRLIDQRLRHLLNLALSGCHVSVLSLWLGHLTQRTQHPRTRPAR